MKPRIMICNVHKGETKEEIKETNLHCNEFLHTTAGVENNTELIFSEPAAGGDIMHWVHFEVRPNCES